MLEATVPLSITGKTGRIQAGVIDCIIRGFPVNGTWYRKIAVVNLIATYIQKRTRSETMS